MKLGIVHRHHKQKDRIRNWVLSNTRHEVIWTTSLGGHALDLSKNESPDLILLDVMISNYDGIKITKLLMEEASCPILLLSDNIDRDSVLIFEEMAHGALDVVHVPILDEGEEAEELEKKLVQFSHLIESNLQFNEKPIDLMGEPQKEQEVELILLGASTGGPLALASIISSFPKNFQGCVVIVQHVDEKFCGSLAHWLSERSHLPLRMIERECYPEPGMVYISNASAHLVMTPHKTLGYSRESSKLPYKPSIDLFFKSVARYWNTPSVAVLLTGMGADGAEGLQELKRASWFTIAEHESSCVVYGMPKAAIAKNAATEVLTLDKIPISIMRSLKNSKNKMKKG